MATSLEREDTYHNVCTAVHRKIKIMARMSTDGLSKMLID
jgi:hypothetical protein